MSETAEIEAQPRSIEDIAMSKIIDLDETPRTFASHSFYRDVLEKILKTGAYTQEFADRIRDEEYIKHFRTKYNYRYLSSLQGRRILWAPRQAAVIFDAQKAADIDEEVGIPGEKLIHRRVSPRDFLGLVLVPEIFSSLLPLALEIWQNKPQNALPIYDARSMDLLWPTEMTHEEIVRMLMEKGQGENHEG